MRAFYDNPPETKKEYGDWTVIGPPLPSIELSGKRPDGGRRYQTKWRVPCECACGWRDLVLLSNLKNGNGTRCINCHNEHMPESPGRIPKQIVAFGESKSAREWTDDDRCTCCQQTIHKRLRDGLEPEAAVANKPYWEKYGDSKISNLLSTIARELK